MPEHAEQNVIVTGANRGIGRHLAEAFAHEGSTVGMLGRRREALEEAADDIREQDPDGELSPLVADVSDPEAVDLAIDEWVDEHDGVHSLINNAGITRDGLFMRMGEDDWSQVMDVNLDGSFFCSQAVIRPMMRERWGRIVMMSSVIGLMGNAGQANYAASKAGMVGLAKSLARELGSRGITANVLAPGYIDTEMTDEMDDDQREELMDNTPMERLGQPEDVVEAALFLTSERADFITGEVIRVDGGLAM